MLFAYRPATLGCMTGEMIIPWATYEVNLWNLKRTIRQTRAALKLANEALETTDNPEKWLELIEAQQAVIKEAWYCLEELQRA